MRSTSSLPQGVNFLALGGASGAIEAITCDLESFGLEELTSTVLHGKAEDLIQILDRFTP